MFTVVDFIAILLILIIAFLGYKRGFIRTLFGFISFWVAIVLVILLYKPMAIHLSDNTTIDDWIEDKFSQKYQQKVEENVDDEGVENSEEVGVEPTSKWDTEELQDAVNNLPQNIKDMVGFDEIKENTKQAIAQKTVEISLNVISMVIIYVLVRIVLAVVCFILDKIMKIPVLKQINEILGLLFGGISGVLQVYMILGIITFLSSFITMDIVNVYIKSSLLVSQMYENNLLISLIF